MTTAREIMTPSAVTLGRDDTARDAARALAEHDIGAVPVCTDGHVDGMVTDRDLMMEVVLEGRDPSTPLGDIIPRVEVVTIGADDSVDEAIRTMTDHAVRRLPVIDGRQMVGMVSQADLAVNCPPEHVAEMVGAVSAAP